MTSTSWMHETAHSKLGHWGNPEGWDGEGGGRGVWDVGHMYPCGWFVLMYGKKTPQYCEEFSLQLKFKNWLKKKKIVQKYFITPSSQGSFKNEASEVSRTPLLRSYNCNTHLRVKASLKFPPWTPPLSFPSHSQENSCRRQFSYAGHLALVPQK